MPLMIVDSKIIGVKLFIDQKGSSWKVPVGRFQLEGSSWKVPVGRIWKLSFVLSA